MVSGVREIVAPGIVAAAVMAGCAPTTAREQQREAVALPAVTITANGARSAGLSGDETAATCTRFRLSPAQVTAFFAQARPVDERAYNHDVAMSPCYAAGTIRLADGDGSTWTIDEARRGQLVRPDGSRRYLYCAACPTPPFEEAEGDLDGG